LGTYDFALLVADEHSAADVVMVKMFVGASTGVI